MSCLQISFLSVSHKNMLICCPKNQSCQLSSLISEVSQIVDFIIRKTYQIPIDIAGMVVAHLLILTIAGLVVAQLLILTTAGMVVVGVTLARLTFLVGMTHLCQTPGLRFQSLQPHEQAIRRIVQLSQCLVICMCVDLVSQ